MTYTPLSRSAGYKIGAPKEQAALAVVHDFIGSVVGIQPAQITGKDQNRLRGDFEIGKATAECKGQPIDPDKYARNFVEVFEDTGASQRPYHADGFGRVCEILGLGAADLAKVSYRDARTESAPRLTLGSLPFVSCSIESIAGSDLTIYANPSPQRTFVYVYRPAFLLKHVRDQVVRGGMWRGRGRSNDDSFCVFVPISPARWHRTDGGWSYVGDGREPIETLKGIAC